MVEKCDFSYDLKRRFEACRRFGKMNYYAAYAFLIVAAAASAAATISIAAILLLLYNSLAPRGSADNDEHSTP